MSIYPVVNQKTGEKKELSMTMAEYSTWRDDNPDWIKIGTLELQTSERLEKYMTS